MINYEQILTDLISWVREKMAEIGGTKAVLGISGGKDSSVAAALMARALGSENVIGVLMPDGIQPDIEFAEGICRHLGILSVKVDISPVTTVFHGILEDIMPGRVSATTRLNLPPRVRMTLLYALSQSIDQSRVINTSNLSEDWVGYATIYGDTAGAFSPFGMLTTEEVIALGHRLGVPPEYLEKPPADGLTGRTDEDVLGITYQVINEYIRTGTSRGDTERIDALHQSSRFKFQPIPMFDPRLPIHHDIAGIYETVDQVSRR